MLNSLFAPLDAILQAADQLHAQDDGILNAVQEKLVESIASVARDMQTLFVSLSGLSSESVRELLSFETRSHLASIIGYAEVLLDQSEGALTAEQAQLVQQVRANGTQLLTTVIAMLDSSS